MVSKTKPLLIIGFVWPEPDSSAAGKRMMDLISLFQSSGWAVTFASAAKESDHMADLDALGVKTVPISINDSGFDAFIRELQPSMVLFDRFVTEEQFGWRVANHCPEALRMLDTEDLHCLRRARRKAVREERIFSREDLLTDETAKREVAAILRSDLSLIISEAEIEVLEDFFHIDSTLLQYLPFDAEPIASTGRKEWPSFEERSHFVMIGNFSHSPNLDAAHLAKKDIWPLIHSELPEAELHIYGAYPSSEVKSLHNPGEGFHIKGRVQDAQSVVRQARVSLAPLRFGAGLKGKLLESMQCGTPIVTTDIGAEGMYGDREWPGRIVNDPAGFASAAVDLYENKPKWQRAQACGIDVINSRFADMEFPSQLLEKIRAMRSNLDDHRRQNFTGAMLRHHTISAQEYMSRWIETKNRLKKS